MRMNKLLTTLSMGLVLGLALTACGSNDSKEEDAGAGTAGTAAGTNGTAGTGAGTNSQGTSGNSADSGMPQLTCDDTIQNVSSCGSESCTAPSGLAAMYCQVSCCTTDNKCGVRNTSTQLNSDACEPPAAEDPRCKNVTGGGSGGGFGQVACCTSDGFCGISIMGSQCFSSAGFFGGGMDPVKCDEAGGDAGL